MNKNTHSESSQCSFLLFFAIFFCVVFYSEILFLPLPIVGQDLLSCTESCQNFVVCGNVFFLGTLLSSQMCLSRFTFIVKTFKVTLFFLPLFLSPCFSFFLTVHPLSFFSGIGEKICSETKKKKPQIQ